MKTITIKNGKNLNRTNFEDLADLQDYLSNISIDKEFILSHDMEKELDKRYEELKLGKVKGIPWKDVKKEFEKRITS
jgi:hypothetical protein